jgi:membrane fusion protein (multidrug efflux system)
MGQGDGHAREHPRAERSARPGPNARPRTTSEHLGQPLFLALITLVATVAFVTTGCGKKGGGPGDPQQNRTAQAAANGEKKTPAEPAIPVAVEPAHFGPIASYYTATATLTAEKEAEILARVTGVIQTLSCEEGDVVEKGHPLLQIDDHEYQLRLRQAEANTANLQDRHNRLKGMFEQQLVSAQEYEAATNELKSAEAAEELARLELSYSTVRAPFAGRIVRRMVDVGQNVNVGTPLFVLSDFNPLLAVVHVPSKEFKRLMPDQPVQLILDSGHQSLKGHIKLVSPVIDPASGTIKVTIEISDYPPGTRPGDFAEVRIVTEQHEKSLLVPKEAVFTDRGDRVVYVAADSTAERRVVEVGFEDDENSEILAGVTAGEGVVIKGQRSLKHGAPIKVLPDEETASPATSGTVAAESTSGAGSAQTGSAKAAPAPATAAIADSTKARTARPDSARTAPRQGEGS